MSSTPPRPFLPTMEPDPDEYFLTFEFTTEEPSPAPEDLTASGREYVREDMHTFRSRSGYDVIETNGTQYRYTASLPNLTLDITDYYTVAIERLRDVIPETTAEFTLKLYLSGYNATDNIPIENLLSLSETPTETTIDVSAYTDSGNVALITFTPELKTKIH